MPKVKIRAGHVFESLNAKTNLLEQFTAGAVVEVTDQQWRQLKAAGAATVVKDAPASDVSGVTGAIAADTSAKSKKVAEGT